MNSATALRTSAGVIRFVGLIWFLGLRSVAMGVLLSSFSSRGITIAPKPAPCPGTSGSDLHHLRGGSTDTQG